jgi:Holliday junction DNA helicase RuvB
MTSKVRVVSPLQIGEEVASEARLRPTTLEDYVGQERVKENLRVFIEAARQRGEALEHVLLSGPPGLGKTTLAHIIAETMDVPIKVASGPVFQTPADLLGVLSHLKPRERYFKPSVTTSPA